MQKEKVRPGLAQMLLAMAALAEANPASKSSKWTNKPFTKATQKGATHKQGRHFKSRVTTTARIPDYSNAGTNDGYINIHVTPAQYRRFHLGNKVEASKYGYVHHRPVL